ncbi:hypothetical protein FQA39_LY02520 [Lamprigera yunnana]|nr:hypothetical protein FQA39_LY02520 [Lamprigera yunnana]
MNVLQFYYLSIIQPMHQIFVDYYYALFDANFKNNMNILENNHKDLIDKVINLKSHHIFIVQDIRNRLKPLYGYKSNKHLLEKIINEMNEAALTFQEIDFQQMFLADYKVMLEKHQESYLTNHKEIMFSMCTLKQQCLLNITKSPLILQFQRKLKLMETFLATVNNDTNTDSAYYEKLKPLNTLNFDLNLKNINTMQRAIRVEMNEECTEQDNILETFIDNCLQKLIVLSDMESKWSYEIEREEKIFKNDIERITQLYTVKYKNEN